MTEISSATGIKPQKQFLTSSDFLWLSFTLCILLLLTQIIPVPPNDYWWYLRLGKDILASGSVPTVDTYSFTVSGQPMLYQSWLAAVILWLAYSWGGITLTFLLRGLAIGFTFGIVWKIAREQGAGVKTASVLVLLAGLSTSNNWVIRPQMLVYPLFAFCVWMLFRWQRGQNRGLWLLPLGSLLWANLHGSFPLLFLLAGSALLSGKGNRRILLQVLLASLAAVLINPRGIELFKFVVETFTNPGAIAFSKEWDPTSNSGWQMNLFFGWLLLLFPLMAFSLKRLSLVDWIWFLMFGWLALTGIRFVIWFHLLLVVFTARLISDWSNRWVDRGSATTVPAANMVLGSILLILPLAFTPGLRGSWWQDAPEAMQKTPQQAVDWLRNQPDLPGELWTDFDYSSYVLFTMPERLVWIDPRMHLVYPVEVFERYMRIAAASPGWQQELERDGIRLMLLSKEKEPGLLRALSEDQDWCQAYLDQESVIYQRCNGK